jgi:hypothetical protein
MKAVVILALFLGLFGAFTGFLSINYLISDVMPQLESTWMPLTIPPEAVESPSPIHRMYWDI